MYEKLEESLAEELEALLAAALDGMRRGDLDFSTIVEFQTRFLEVVTDHCYNVGYVEG